MLHRISRFLSGVPWLLHMAGWALYFLLDIGVNAVHYGWDVYSDLLLDSFLQLIVIMAVTYAVVFYFFDNRDSRRKLGSTIATLIICAFVIYLSRYLISNRTFGLAGGEWLPAIKVFKNAIRDMSVVALAACLVIIHDWRTMSRRIADLEKTKIELQYRTLLNQLQPHFLFNSFNNIYALINRDPEKGRKALLALSDVLEYVVYKPPDSLTTLGEELEIVVSYLQLMRLKYGPALKADISVSGYEKAELPSFFLLSLAENAFKHGSKKNGEFHFSIGVQHAGGKHHLQVRNSCAGSRSAGQEGIGNSLVQRQIQLFDKHFGKMETVRGPSSYSVSLELKEAIV